MLTVDEMNWCSLASVNCKDAAGKGHVAGSYAIRRESRARERRREGIVFSQHQLQVYYRLLPLQPRPLSGRRH